MEAESYFQKKGNLTNNMGLFKIFNTFKNYLRINLGIVDKYSGLEARAYEKPKRIDEIPHTEELRDVSHTHIYTNYRPQANKWYLEQGFRNLAVLTRLTLKRGVNSLGITNFDDGNYEFWTSQSQLDSLPGSWKYFQDERLTVVITDKEEKIYFYKGEEIQTSEGHVYFAGGKSGRENNIPHGRSLDDTLNEAEKEVCKDNPDRRVKMSSADHAYGLLGIGKKATDEQKRRIDVYEWSGDFVQGTLGNKKAEKEATRLDKPLVTGEDSHRPKAVGRCYNIYDGRNLDYNSGERFMASKREETIKKKFVPVKRRGSLFASLHHMVMNTLYHWIFKETID